MPGTDFVAKRLAALSESATLALNARAKKLAGEGRTIYNLTAGELAADTPAYIQRAVAKNLHLNKYTPVAGLPELRRKIAEEARQFYGLDWIEPANVVVTGGAKPALYAGLLALVDPGDEVIVPVPAWVSYNHLVELVGGKVIPVPLTDEFDLDPAATLAKLSPRTKVIIINSPHNPTGALFSKTALMALAKGLRGSDVTVLADDIYAKLVYNDSFTPVPACGFENPVIVNGFSKSQALTGWRIGYIIAKKPIAEAITKLLSHTNGNAAIQSQQAALAALERHDTPPAETMKTLNSQRKVVCRALDAMPALRYRSPGGAFYVFIDVRGVTDSSAEWCERLLAETGVALVPGEAFGAPGFARLTFVTDEATLKKALEQLKKFVAKGLKA
jgi:aspartate aminotransferase